jgi:hypothetical protein
LRNNGKGVDELSGGEEEDEMFNETMRDNAAANDAS